MASLGVDYLPQTIHRLEGEFGVRVRVFGIKDFGEVTEKKVLDIAVADRPKFQQKINDDMIPLNLSMRKAVPAANFIEVLGLFCGGDPLACSLFTPEGYLISPDGGHLTKEGALYLSSKIRPLLQ